MTKSSLSITRRYPLPLILLLATVLRLWRLGAKPLWTDELYTAFYSLGKNLTAVPTDTLLSPADYWALINDPGNAQQAAQAVTTHSNHPPLFFMAMNGWLQGLGTSVWSLRAFSVLWGVVAVAGMYYLGRRVAGPRVGKVAALLMAVSPYGIYLSQEARHYSLAVAIAIFALINWVALLKDDRSPLRWVCWIGLNALGLYVHYFYAFGIIAQWLVILSRLLWRQHRRTEIITWLLAMGGTVLLYVPWLPTALTHFQGDDGTSWLSPTLPLWQAIIMPWLQSWAAGLIMLILLPVEQMPTWVTIPAALIMLVVFAVVLTQIIRGWQREPQLDSWAPLVSYGLVVWGVMLAITYGLGKDLTLAPRYFFMLYPAATAVAALALARCRRWILGVAIAAGIVSQLFISYDLALLKPFLPGQIGQRLGTDSQPTIVLIAPVGHAARTLSYVLAMPETADAQIAFTPPASLEPWQPILHNTDTIPDQILTLWLVEPNRQNDFPEKVFLPDHSCSIIGKRIKTEGARQQQYQCFS